MKTVPHKNVKRIVILGAIGIGNLLLFSPCLRALRTAFPEAHIALIILKRGFRELFVDDPDIDEIIVVDYKVQNTVRKKIDLIRMLRKKRFDLCITTFPANRMEYNLLPFLAGVRHRVAHRYASGSLRKLSFLQNYRIPVDNSLHDLKQNSNLLIALGISGGVENRLSLRVSPEHTAEAEGFIKRCGFPDNAVIIGIHAGSSTERDMHMKRWDTANFTVLCRRLKNEYNARFLIFGGPEEELVKREISDALGEAAFTVEGKPLLTTAALIGECGFFISNDSGLMHVAVAMETPVAALFGPTDPGRTAPYGPQHRVIRLGLECSPCWSIRNVGKGKIECIFQENRCLTELTVSDVYEKVSDMLTNILKSTE